MNLNNQNNQKSLQLLAAQAQLYSKSKWWVYLIFLVTLAPLLAFLLKAYLPDIQNLLLIISAGGLFLVYLLNKYVNKKIKTAALIQEEMDTDIYEWEWNDVQISENKIIKDVRNRAAGNYKMPDERLPWYTKAIETIPDKSVQILLCQRENIAWDWQLRKNFGAALKAIFWITLLFVLIWGWVSEATLHDWLSINLLLVSGFLYKTFELWQAFHNIGSRQEQTLHQIEAEITAYKKDPKPIPVERLQLFQHNIYQSRKENAAVPDWLFNLSKKVLQNRTSETTIEIIQELKT